MGDGGQRGPPLTIALVGSSAPNMVSFGASRLGGLGLGVGSVGWVFLLRRDQQGVWWRNAKRNTAPTPNPEPTTDRGSKTLPRNQHPPPDSKLAYEVTTGKIGTIWIFL